jgi:hypothetical protein
MLKDKLRQSEQGQAVMEFAVSFAFLALLLIAAIFFCVAGWLQAATSAATIEASRYSAGHWGNAINPEAGYGPFYDALSSIGSGQGASFVGQPSIVTNPYTRSVTVSVGQTGLISPGGINLSFFFRGGAFSRIQDWVPGPPDPWE